MQPDFLKAFLKSVLVLQISLHENGNAALETIRIPPIPFTNLYISPIHLKIRYLIFFLLTFEVNILFRRMKIITVMLKTQKIFQGDEEGEGKVMLRKRVEKR